MNSTKLLKNQFQSFSNSSKELKKMNTYKLSSKDYLALTPQDNNTTRLKDDNRPISLMNIGTNNLNKILGNQILESIKSFSAYIEMIIWVLFFSLLMWYNTFIILCILKNHCIPGITWCRILLMCYWILFASTLLRIFVCIFIRGIGL